MPVGKNPALHITIPEPIPVSPLIRATRWGLLGLGVVWGAFRYRQICEKHADIRSWEHEQDTELTLENNRKARLALREQLIILWKQIGLPFNEGISSFKADDLFRDE
uniref:ATP synthase F(0) complex subunit e, mitochondrial n=1 Tax=Acrobeloides nanus TaxID=290746 RepID=A0A914EGI1_9BILA